MSEKPDFEGHKSRDCDGHGIAGARRAWCFDCGEWCYPNIPCHGCARPMLRDMFDRLIAGEHVPGDELERLRDLL